MTSVVRSVRGLDVRLTDERWAHITEEHNELAGLRLEVLETIGHPTRILQGAHGAVLAVREIDPGKWIIAVYREEADSGFVITAFLTRR